MCLLNCPVKLCCKQEYGFELSRNCPTRQCNCPTYFELSPIVPAFIPPPFFGSRLHSSGVFSKVFQKPWSSVCSFFIRNNNIIRVYTHTDPPTPSYTRLQIRSKGRGTNSVRKWAGQILNEKRGCRILYEKIKKNRNIEKWDNSNNLCKTTPQQSINTKNPGGTFRVQPGHLIELSH